MNYVARDSIVNPKFYQHVAPEPVFAHPENVTLKSTLPSGLAYPRNFKGHSFTRKATHRYSYMRKKDGYANATEKVFSDFTFYQFPMLVKGEDFLYTLDMTPELNDYVDLLKFWVCTELDTLPIEYIYRIAEKGVFKAVSLAYDQLNILKLEDLNQVKLTYSNILNSVIPSTRAMLTSSAFVSAPEALSGGIAFFGPAAFEVQLDPEYQSLAVKVLTGVEALMWQNLSKVEGRIAQLSDPQAIIESTPDSRSPNTNINLVFDPSKGAYVNVAVNESITYKAMPTVVSPNPVVTEFQLADIVPLKYMQQAPEIRAMATRDYSTYVEGYGFLSANDRVRLGLDKPPKKSNLLPIALAAVAAYFVTKG